MLLKIRRLSRPESGQAAVTLAIVVVAVIVSAYLLLRTTQAAISINKKAEKISGTSGGINTATDSVLELEKTNKTAKSILETAEALGKGEAEGRVGQIVTLAKSIDGLAISINGTAGTINGTARNINTEAVDILTTAKEINADVRQINANIDGTIGLANAIKADTGAIVGQAREIHKQVAKLDATDGH